VLGGGRRPERAGFFPQHGLKQRPACDPAPLQDMQVHLLILVGGTHLDAQRIADAAPPGVFTEVSMVAENSSVCDPRVWPP